MIHEHALSARRPGQLWPKRSARRLADQHCEASQYQVWNEAVRRADQSIELPARAAREKQRRRFVDTGLQCRNRTLNQRRCRVL